MSHADLLRRHLQNAGKPRAEQDATIYAEDLVVEFPYAPEGHTRRLEGPEACLAFFSRISSFAQGFRIGEPTILSEGDAFVAEYHGSATFKDTGAAVRTGLHLGGHCSSWEAGESPGAL